MTRQDVSPSVLGGSVRVTLLGRGTLFLVVTLSLDPRNVGGGFSGADGDVGGGSTDARERVGVSLVAASLSTDGCCSSVVGGSLLGRLVI